LPVFVAEPGHLRSRRRNFGAQRALPVMAGDMRLDFYFGGDHSFSHGVDVLGAKLKLIDNELNDFLPKLAAQFQ
jgi:hypothetical protein